jgi:hypothetical protein
MCSIDDPHTIKIRYKVVDGWPMIFYSFKIENEEHYFSIYADEGHLIDKSFKEISDTIMVDLNEEVKEKFNQNG